MVPPVAITEIVPSLAMPQIRALPAVKGPPVSSTMMNAREAGRPSFGTWMIRVGTDCWVPPTFGKVANTDGVPVVSTLMTMFAPASATKMLPNGSSATE